jgi:hypothetical protein
VATLHSTNAPDETNHCSGARNNGTGNWQHKVVVWQIKKCDCSQFTQICFVHGCTDERDQSIPDSILVQFSVATKAVLIHLIGKQQWRQPNEAVRLKRDAWVK